MTNETNNNVVPMVVELQPNEASKLLKKVLTKAFPGTKFSLRLSRGTAWGTVTISWTDGPTTAEVDAIAQPWSGKRFESMDDSTHYVNANVEVDGRRYRSRLGYVMTAHDTSDERKAEIVAMLQREYPDSLASDYRCAAHSIACQTRAGAEPDLQLVHRVATHNGLRR